MPVNGMPLVSLVLKVGHASGPDRQDNINNDNFL
jgi:hypothetical protein